MGYIAFWFTMLVLNLIDCVVDKVYDKQGWSVIFNMAFLGIAAYFLLEAWQKEFGGG